VNAFLLLLACGGGSDLPTPLPPDQAGESFAFARMSDAIVELELPASSRPGGAAAPERVPVQGPFNRVRTVEGVATWEAPVPIRPRNLFFSNAPPGMSVEDAAGKKLGFSDGTSGAKRQRTWDFTAETIQLRLADADGEPAGDAYYLRYDRAEERENQLNLEPFKAASELVEEDAEKDFACRSLQLGEDTRTGLFLPSGGVIAWDVTIPAAGVLAMNATILPPEMNEGVSSDGATVTVEVEIGGSAEVAGSVALTVSEWQDVKFDLSKWAGQAARVRFKTTGGASDELDYVFMAEPVLYTPTTKPKRLLLVFIDTLRPDHMGLYGYERDTTPRLGEWAKGAAVFDNARSIAPWTLPSTRTALSGRQPELWTAAPTLPAHLSRAGWATGAFVGNVYLSSNFEMSDDWDHHNAVNWPVAEVQVDKVEAFLERYPDRDAAVMLHVMDMHLPYTEPLSYRYKWASKIAPEGLSERFLRGSILKAMKKEGKEEAVKQYVIDRYDQNMAYLDDQISDLIADLGEDATVVLFSDHGEEFWDHDGFEHGHTLYDELLRVPFIVKHPGLPASRVEAPVSLLDVTPTLLDLLDIEADPATLQGLSLADAARGDAEALTALTERDHAFGRPLYGNPRWGVIDGDLKWTTHEGADRLYNLAKDPGETKNVLGKGQRLPALQEAFSAGIGQPTPTVWRVYPGKATRTPSKDLVVTFTHPDGFEHAWLGDDPLVRSSMSLEHDGDTVDVTFHKGYTGTKEIYLQPAGDPGEFGALAMIVKDGRNEVTREARATLEGEVVPDGKKHVLMRANGGNRSFEITFAVAPVPPEDGIELSGADGEVNEQLQMLGYQEREDE